MKEMFRDAKKGAKVWSYRLGWGKITTVDENLPFPVEVEFDDVPSDAYLLDGREHRDDLYPILFWNKVEIKIPDRPNHA